MTVTIIPQENLGALISLGGNPVLESLTFLHNDATAVGSEAQLGDACGKTITQFYDATGKTLYIYGGAQDAAAGTGALTVRVYGWGACTLYDGSTADRFFFEDVTMTGATVAALTGNYKVNPIYAEVLTAGSDGAANGEVIISDQTKAASYGGISAGMINQTLIQIFVPAGAIGFYDADIWFTCATTEDDGIIFKHYQRQLTATEANTVEGTVKTVGFSAPSSADTFEHTRREHVSGVLKGGFRHMFKGVDFGTSAQTMNFSITWGVRFL